MRKLLSVGIATVFLFGLALQARAQDDAKALIAKAIKAHGMKDSDLKKAIQTKTKGKIELMGGLSFTQEVSIQRPNKFKDVMELELNGMKIVQTTVFDGKQLWTNVNGKTFELKDKYLEAVKEVMDMMKVMELAFIKDKGVKMELTGEIQVENHPALGVRISREGLKDVTLYFDKKTGLIVKLERRGIDPMSGNEVAEERIIKEYKKVDGRQVAKKVIMNRDGKLFLEAEVLEVKLVDKLDDSEFAKP